MREAEQATRGSAVRLTAELLGRLLSLASSLVIAAGLGVEAFGVFAAVSGVALVVAELADLGLQATASRALVAGTLPLGPLARARGLLTALVATAAFLLPWAGAGAATAFLPAAAAAWLEPALEALPLLTPLLLYSSLSGGIEWLGVALRAADRRGQEAALLLSARALALAFVVLALSRASGLFGVAWAQALSTLAPLALGVGLVVRGARRKEFAAGPDGNRSPAQSDRVSIRNVLRESFPLALNGLLALVALRLELLLLLTLRGPREAGLFAAALKLIESLGGIPAAISGGAMPALTREALGGGAGARSRTAATVALVAAPAALGLSLLAPQVVSVLGPAYVESAAPLRVLAWALVATFLNALLLHGLLAAGRASWLPRLTAVRLIAALLLAVVLVPRLGAVGGAVGFLGAELLLLLIAARACAAADFALPLARPLGLALLASLPMGAVVASSRVALAPAILIGVSTYALTLAALWRFGGRARAAARLAADGAWKRA